MGTDRHVPVQPLLSKDILFVSLPLQLLGIKMQPPGCWGISVSKAGRKL